MFFGGKSERNTQTGGSTEPRSVGFEKRPQAWLSFSKVQKVFPDIPPKTLCTLVELSDFSPSNVFAVVPQASSEQLSKFFDIVEESRSPQDKNRPTVEDTKNEPAPKSDTTKSEAVESPTGGYREILDEIKKSLPNKSEQNLNFSFSNDFENKLLRVLGASNPSTVPDADFYKLTYDRLRQNPLDRSPLENVHAARAHRYGMAHFGPKHWYKESPNLAAKLKTQSDRRKFRAGIKGDVDFLNQLNMLDFEECFKSGSSDALEAFKLQDPVLISELKKKLEGIPPIELIKFVNEEKASKLLKIFEKIVSYAHFSQSMTDFFGHDDALQPAFAVVSQVLRQNENIGTVLKDSHTTFLGLAQSFPTKSYLDRDFESNHKHKTNRSMYRRQSSGREVARRRERTKPYHNGYCRDFQKKSFCPKRHCAFLHECAICRSKRHGKEACPRSI